jgi:predicted nucleic acid-binding protein
MDAFLDASVLFSATYSKTGASREIIRLGIQGEIQLVSSDLVSNEALLNLKKKTPEVAPYLLTLFSVVPFRMVRPSKKEVLTAMEYTEFKDAPVFAAALCAKVNYLVSLDQAHLVGVSAVKQGSGLSILLPGDYLRLLRKNSDKT